MDEKDLVSPAEVDAEDSDDEGRSETDRVYDLDAEVSEPAQKKDDGATAAREAAPEVPEEEPAPAKGRSTRIPRKQFLDRLHERTAAITKLTREKAGIEKERAALLEEKIALAAQASDLKDKWLRSVAELENYRKRSAKEWELLKHQTKSEIILEVLNSLDDFERAFAVAEDRGDSELVTGIRLIYNNLVQVLGKFGVAEVDALHQPFDPTRHMAIGQIETTEAASGHVAQVVQKGYVLNGLIIRPARVIVAK